MAAYGPALATILAAALALASAALNRKPTKLQEADTSFTRMERLVERLEKDIEDRSRQIETLTDKYIEAEAEIDRLRKALRGAETRLAGMANRMERLEIMIGRAASLLRERGIEAKDFEV